MYMFTYPGTIYVYVYLSGTIYVHVYLFGTVYVHVYLSGTIYVHVYLSGTIYVPLTQQYCSMAWEAPDHKLYMICYV